MNKIPYKNKKGVELTLNTIVMLAVMIIVLIIVLYFFSSNYLENSNTTIEIGKNAINTAKNYK